MPPHMRENCDDEKRYEVQHIDENAERRNMPRPDEENNNDPQRPPFHEALRKHDILCAQLRAAQTAHAKAVRALALCRAREREALAGIGARLRHIIVVVELSVYRSLRAQREDAECVVEREAETLREKRRLHNAAYADLFTYPQPRRRLHDASRRVF